MKADNQHTRTVAAKGGNAAPRIGLALAGGGPLGAIYEIGALAAIEEAIEGLDLNNAEVYVGISAGGIIASGLANGISAHEMCRMFIESDSRHSHETPFNPEMLLRPDWREMSKRAASLPGLLLDSTLHYLMSKNRRSIANSFERLKDALPAGLLSGESLQNFLATTFSKAGRTNDFRQLKHKLILVATDLDSGESIKFGQPGLDDVPISRAAQASAAVPGLFTPVQIKGRHVVDGVLRKTLHASIALDHGVDVLFCLNPIVPYNAKIMYAPGKLAEGGMLTVLSQALRSIIHSRVEIGMAKYSHTYPNTDILHFEPGEEDAEMFFTNLFSTSNRRQICENAYQNTRAILWKRREELQAKLERHGLRLKLSVLQDANLTLVKQVHRRPDKLGLNHLETTLDHLERHLKLT